MQNSFAMGILQGVTEVWHQPERLGRREPLRVHRLAEVDSIDKLHHQIVKPPGLAEIMDGNDVRMVELCQHAGLAGKAIRETRFAGEPRSEDFQSNRPVQVRLPRLEHHRHAAAADFPLDLQIGKSSGNLGERRPIAGIGWWQRRLGRREHGAKQALRALATRRGGGNW